MSGFHVQNASVLLGDKPRAESSGAKGRIAASSGVLRSGRRWSELRTMRRNRCGAAAGRRHQSERQRSADEPRPHRCHVSHCCVVIPVDHAQQCCHRGCHVSHCCMVITRAAMWCGEATTHERARHQLMLIHGHHVTPDGLVNGVGTGVGTKRCVASPLDEPSARYHESGGSPWEAHWTKRCGGSRTSPGTLKRSGGASGSESGTNPLPHR